MAALPHSARLFVCALALSLPFAGDARADAYPVSGHWTYENASEKGRAESCGMRKMQFDGELRHDTGSGAPEYKNVSVRQSDAQTWRVVDEFFTGTIRGNVSYTLRAVDADHIEITLDMGGTVWLLRRCNA